MLSGFYNTDKSYIVAENKRLFGVDVCPTCHGQLVDAYNRLNTYFKNENIMAKKEVVKVEKPKTGYKLKSEFIGSTYVNGTVEIKLSEVDLSEVEKLFTEQEIKTYFDS
jgi:hypothetical protein